MVALAALAGCSGMPIAGSGPVETESRDVDSFEALKVGLGADTVVMLDGGSSVELSGQANLLEHIRTEVVDGELRIESDRMLLDADIDVVVHTGDLDSVEVTGSGTLEADDVDQDSLAVRSTGSAETTLRGNVGHLTVESTGSGLLELSGLNAGQVDLEQSGSSDVRIVVAGPVVAETTGSGLVEVSGSADRGRTADNGIRHLGRDQPGCGDRRGDGEWIQPCRGDRK